MTGDTLAAAPTGAAAHLRRVLGLRDLAVVAAASMGPAFSLATTLAAMVAAAGRWTWLALVICAVLMAMIAAGYKRLGERMRDAGSSYAWIRAAFGPEGGAYGAWVLLVASMFAVLATALPAGTYTLDLLRPDLAANALAVALAACGWVIATRAAAVVRAAADGHARARAARRRDRRARRRGGRVGGPPAARRGGVHRALRSRGAGWCRRSCSASG